MVKKINIVLYVLMVVSLIISTTSIIITIARGAQDQPITTPSSRPPYNSIESGNGEDHICDFKFKETIAPTCEGVGFDVLVCECGKTTTTNETPALGHNYDEYHICKVCNKIDSKYFTPGLTFEINSNKTAFIVTGYNGGENIVNIPSQYSLNNKDYFPVSEIANEAFIGDSITRINIAGITKIGNYAFKDCKFLNEVIISDEVSIIGDGAFYGCNELKKINIPKSTTTLGKEAFAYCNSLVDVLYEAEKLENKLLSNSNIFINSNVESTLTISDSVTDIPAYLAYKSNFKTINIGKNVKSIGDYAFSLCYNLSTINYNAIKLQTNLTQSSNSFNTQPHIYVTVNFLESVEEIPSYLFYNCKNIGTVNFNQNVKSIGDYAFTNTSISQTNLTVSITSIGAYAFSECSNLTEFTFPDTVKTVKEGALYHTISLTTLNFGSGINIIPKNLCYASNNLSTINFTSSITEIEEYAFYQTAISEFDTTNLTNLAIIKTDAFSNCYLLKTLKLTKNINIFKSAFNSSIDYIYLSNKELVGKAMTYSDLGDSLKSIKKIYILKTTTQEEGYTKGAYLSSFITELEEAVNDDTYITYHNHEYDNNKCIYCDEEK